MGYMGIRASNQYLECDIPGRVMERASGKVRKCVFAGIRWIFSDTRLSFNY